MKNTNEYDVLLRIVEVIEKKITLEHDTISLENKERIQIGIEKIELIINKTDINMGDKIEVGNIDNNSGQIAIGNNIRISTSTVEKAETVSRIEELIQLLRSESDIEEVKRQYLITNFDKIREEVLESNPDKTKVNKWLHNTKSAIEGLVLSHHATEAIHWVYNNFNWLVNTISK